MEPINGLSKLAELIRRKGVEAGSASDKAAGTKPAGAHDESPPAALDLEQQIRGKLRQLQRSSATPAALRRVVIESMLVWEYRAEIHNEPKFATLVNQVQRHIEDEPEIKRALEKLIAQLTQ